MVYRNSPIMLQISRTCVVDFDVILGMDWLNDFLLLVIVGQ